MTIVPGSLSALSVRSTLNADNLILISNLDINGLTADIWDGLLNVSWVIADSDFDPYITGSRIMINQTGSQSYFPILSCLAQDVALIDGVHSCSWRAPDDLPIFSIIGMNMHVQIFAQSLNASPNANIDIQYVDSEIYFSAKNYFLDDGLVDEGEAGAANPMRAMGWGLITILGVALIAKRLWDSMKEEVGDADSLQEVRKPFVGHNDK